MSVIISINGYVVGRATLTVDEIKSIEAQGFVVTKGE